MISIKVPAFVALLDQLAVQRNHISTLALFPTEGYSRGCL